MPAPSLIRMLERERVNRSPTLKEGAGVGGVIRSMFRATLPRVEIRASRTRAALEGGEVRIDELAGLGSPRRLERRGLRRRAPGARRLGLARESQLARGFQLRSYASREGIPGLDSEFLFPERVMRVSVCEQPVIKRVCGGTPSMMVF